jgi:hypothetical protein
MKKFKIIVFSGLIIITRDMLIEKYMLMRKT